MIDTNVFLLAGTKVADVPDDQLLCYKKAVLFLKSFMSDKYFVLLDIEGRVIKEYKKAFSISSYPNMATVFFNYAMEHARYISLKEKATDEFEVYPANKEIREFDSPDRKFIALSYNHLEHPSIIEATDSKWWGIREALKENGITVIFVDEEYIEEKYNRKILYKNK